MAWRADPRAIEHALHLLLVAERHSLGDRHAGQRQHLTQSRREDHQRLPQALDAVDARVLRELAHARQDGILVGEAVHLDVGRQVFARGGRQCRVVLVTEPDDPRPDLRETAREVGHLFGIPGRQHQHVH